VLGITSRFIAMSERVIQRIVFGLTIMTGALCKSAFEFTIGQEFTGQNLCDYNTTSLTNGKVLDGV
jgi:hypothetical protein